MPHKLAQSVTLKVAVLLFLTLLLAIPLAQIGALIDGRGQSRQDAASELAQTYAGPQTLAGPVLHVPYTESWVEEGTDAKGRRTRTPRQRTASKLVFPETLDVAGTLSPQERYRGIFSILFYTFDGKASGRFPAVTPSDLPRQEARSTVEMGTPTVVTGLGDIRGIEGTPALQFAGAPLRFRQQQPSVAEELGRAIHASLEGPALDAFRRGEEMPFTLQMKLVGQERFSIVPLAGETSAHIGSPWPHPSFGGNFLAVRRQVGESGFDADWKVSSLVTSAQAQLAAGPGKGRAALDGLENFSVSLIQPTNVYSMTDRAVKYGALFIGLTLLAAFLFELFRKLRLHPVQYGLVGFSIALFFLLLLALSEKLPFAMAYGIAAAASVTLLAVYFSAVLGSAKRGAPLAGFVGTLYGALYGLLSSEDNALLLGSLLLFGMVAVLMVGTRKVDWYAFGPQQTPAPAAVT